MPTLKSLLISVLQAVFEGQRVVVLVDEYDNFILHSLGDADNVKLARQRFQNVFGLLKTEDDHLQFAFITGLSTDDKPSIRRDILTKDVLGGCCLGSPGDSWKCHQTRF